MSDGLFLECVRRVARDYADISYDERIVDAACMQLVMNPAQFDVLLLPNLYGDIVSDLCAGLVGGLGVVGAANLGSDIGVFEAVHGSAPDIAGQEPREPDGAAAVGGDDAAAHRRSAPRPIASCGRSADVLTAGRVRTRDLGGTASTTGVRRRGLQRALTSGALKARFCGRWRSKTHAVRRAIVRSGSDARRYLPGGARARGSV